MILAPFKSPCAILDVSTGRAKLAKRIAKGECIPVTIRGVIDAQWGDDDGTSIEFFVHVASVTERRTHPMTMDDMLAIVNLAEGRAAELLAALKSSRWTIVSLMNLHCPDAGIGQLCIEKIDAAIARAEGFEG